MPALTPGQIAKVDREGRLSIPMDLLRAVPWWSDATLRVTGELTFKGLMRVYPSSAVSAALRADSNGDVASDAAYIARAVTADRFRGLSLYAEGRLRITKEVCPWLGFSLGEKVELYVQPFRSGLEVMSMEHRFGRLIDAQAEVLPWTFRPLPDA